jgi:hypothetical protein
MHRIVAIPARSSSGTSEREMDKKDGQERWLREITEIWTSSTREEQTDGREKDGKLTRRTYR